MRLFLLVVILLLIFAVTNETGDRDAEGEKVHSSPFGCYMQPEEIYSRKIFIGGVPTDVTQGSFRALGISLPHHKTFAVVLVAMCARSNQHVPFCSSF